MTLLNEPPAYMYKNQLHRMKKVRLQYAKSSSPYFSTLAFLIATRSVECLWLSSRGSCSRCTGVDNGIQGLGLRRVMIGSRSRAGQCKGGCRQPREIFSTPEARWFEVHTTISGRRVRQYYVWQEEQILRLRWLRETTCITTSAVG